MKLSITAKFCAIFFVVIGITTGFNVSAAGTKKIGEACRDSNECQSNRCDDSYCTCGDTTPSDSCAATYGGTAADWKCVNESEDPDSDRREWNFCKKSNFVSSYPKNSTDEVRYPVEHKLLMGQPCIDTDACLSGNGLGSGDVCNETSFDSVGSPKTDPHYDPWYASGEKLNICTPPQTLYAPGVCEYQYGSGDWGWAMGTGELTGVRVCQKAGSPPISTLAEMRKSVVQDDTSKTQVSLFGITATVPEYKLTTPTPKIGIPGVVFTNINKESNITTDASGASWLNIPFLGEYISAVYKYSVGLISLIAVMVLIISGVQIITSAGNSEAISSAKHRITSAVIAIALTAGSYTILYTINPELVNLRNLKILVISGKTIEIPEENDEATASAPTDAQGNVINTISNVGGVITGADGPVTKKATSIDEITDKEFKKDTINGSPADGWAIWQNLNPDQKNQILPYLFIKTGTCTNGDIVPTNINVCGWKNRLMHKTVIPLFQQAMDNAQRYGFQLCPGSSYRDLEEETQLWNTGIVARFKQGSTTWKTNEGKIAKPSCTAPHSSGGAVDLCLKPIGGSGCVTNFSGQMNSIAEANTFYSSLSDSNVYSTILEQIMYQSGWVRYCQEKWHFETAITIRYSKWTDRQARCVMHWDNWLISIPDTVKQKANTLAPGIFP